MIRSRSRARAEESAEPRRRRGAGAVVRVIGVLGRLLVLAGLLMLFYTVYLLWGTTQHTKAAQNDLARRIETQPVVTRDQVATGDIPPARPPAPPSLGDPLFTIVIPDIGLRSVVVAGVGHEELKLGPGLFPDCADVPAGTDCIDGSPYPGEEGNVAISGHRTTHGGPFLNLDQLQPGQIIDIESGPARYRYRVREQKIVSPAEVDVVAFHGSNELTLTTCHPRFSAAQRLILHADYEGASLIAAPTTPGGDPPPPTEAGEGVEGEPTLVPAAPPAVPTDVLILLAVAIAALLGAMALSKRMRMTAVYATLTIVGAAGLWVVVFPQVLQLMPANY